MILGSAIALVADNPTAAPIRSLWDQVAEFEDVPSMALQGYPPHVTLGLYPATPAARLVAAFESVFAEYEGLALRMAKLRWFDTHPMVLWAAPDPRPELGVMFADLAARVPPDSADPHYRPGTWIAHCTLGTRIREDRCDMARAFAEQPLTPFEVRFDRVELVALPALEVVMCKAAAV